jgi:hypothetical protein
VTSIGSSVAWDATQLLPLDLPCSPGAMTSVTKLLQAQTKGTSKGQKLRAEGAMWCPSRQHNVLPASSMLGLSAELLNHC